MLFEYIILSEIGELLKYLVTNLRLIFPFINFVEDVSWLGTVFTLYHTAVTGAGTGKKTFFIGL